MFTKRRFLHFSNVNIMIQPLEPCQNLQFNLHSQETSWLYPTEKTKIQEELLDIFKKLIKLKTNQD